MAFDPNRARGLTDQLAALYTDTELALLRTLAELLTQGIDEPDWAQQQTTRMLQLRRMAEQLVDHLNAAAPTVIEQAIRKAATIGTQAADEDDDTPDRDRTDTTPAAGRTGAAAAAVGGAAAATRLDPRTRTTIRNAWATLTQVNAMLPGIAGQMYQQAVAEIQIRDHVIPRVTPHTGGILGAPTATGTRLDAAQQALDILANRGVTGFRDRAGRNWNLTSYIEMKSRTVLHQEMVDAFTTRMLERGHNLVVVSSHANPAPQCQPYEGQILSLDGETGTVERTSATTGRTIKVRIKATLAEARARGFEHPNCGHALSRYVPGASRTYTTEPDPEGYNATQRQRYLERQVRKWKMRAEVAATDEERRDRLARVRAYQQRLREHTDETGLMRRPRREQINRAR